ncbi:FAD-linked oxidoreductase-like protein [Entophlyctis helioformis]|nr:FAD-linked oxidoreductase-like protein [Entophlyctis helioformis]
MCNVPLLVNSAPVLIETAGKVGLAAPLNAFMKATFFKHFCGGEDLNEVLPTMKAFEQAGIGAILDLAMEADLDAASLSGPAARDQAAKIVAMFKQSIDIAAHQPDSFIAVKVTALVPPALLQNWSNTLGLLQSSFTAADADKDGFLDAAQFASLASTFPGIASAPSTAAELFAAADTNNDGRIDWTDVSALFSLSNTQHAARLVRAPIEPVTDVNRLVSAQDMETSALVMKEMDDLCAYTRDKRVKIMIDAEQTYFQPAIDDVALGLCRKWNAPVASPVADAAAANAIRGPLLFNTYQMYLRDALSRLKADTERASRFGYTFGVKIVRGAYMVSERERATELGLADPIQPSLSATHESYNAAIAFLVDQIAKAQSSASVSASSSSSSVKPIAFVVASHNKESVRVASSLMRQHGISPRDGSVGFAQLMGMQDATTHALAANGYKAYKYIPYGPIEVTVPYLHRRAQENSAVLGALGDDKRNLMTELKIRMGLVRTA